MQNCMTSTGRVVHSLARYLAELHASVYDFDGLLNCLNRNFDELFNIDLAIIFLPDYQVFSTFRI